MKQPIRSVLFIAGILSSQLAFSQTATESSVSSMSDYEVELQAIETTTPASADSLPASGTFYSAQHAPNSAEPWPPLPANINNAPVWDLGEGVFLLSDLDFDYDAPRKAMLKTGSRMSAMDAPSPGDGGDGTGYFTPDFQFNAPDYGTNLWLAITNMADNTAGLLLSNTIADIQYEIQGKPNLTDTNWISEGFVLGSELTNWTPTSIIATNYPNLFLRVLSWQDSDGSGLPDWWQLEFFGHLGVDPYGDPDGDGWNNLQEFQNGTNPNSFSTPPTPQGLTANYNADNTATVNWLPSPGPVTGYTIERDYYGDFGSSSDQSQTFNVSAGTVNIHDTTAFTLPVDLGAFGLTVWVSYKIQAHYTRGDSAWSGTVLLEPSLSSDSLEPGPSEIALAAGPQGSACLAVRNLPVGTTALRLTRVDIFAGNALSNAASLDIPLSTSTNGLYLIPAAWEIGPLDAYGRTDYAWFGQPVNANGQGTAQAVQLVFSGGFSLSGSSFMVPPYFDGRAQLKQNLIFLLRAALSDIPFQFDRIFSGYGEMITNPPNYAYAGFFHLDNPLDSFTMFDPFLPFEDNYCYRNFIFDLSDVNSGGGMTTGMGGGDYGLTLSASPSYQFQAPTANGAAIFALLGTNDTRWLASYPFDSSQLNELGVSWFFDPDGNFFYTMTNGTQNLFGLTNLSAEIAWGNTSDATATLSAGGTVENVDGVFYPETAQPQFQTVKYDFWRVSRFGDETYATMDVLPGDPNFAPTNASRLMIAGVDSSIYIAGYAKLAVLNGYSGVYGYLGQYFDQAYKIDTNGVVTTNQTGILSPYGTFFATEPGPVALVTMPDLDTVERGTGVVYCVSMNVDANNDGNMDLNFNGSDATSQNSPMEFWINNDNDGTGTGQDIYAPKKPDSANDVIQSMRDLEDFARLWICGMPSIDSTEGYQVTLSWANVSSGNPVIKLFQAADTDGGTGYLTDTNIAKNYVGSLVNYSRFGTVSPDAAFTFPGLFFLNPGTKHFIFEGVTPGCGELVMTISQNGNTIAQTGVWLDLHDVRDFYERAVITDNTSGAISNWTSAIETTNYAVSSALGNDTNLIVFVHGINVDDSDWLMDSDTVFKRLYWAGYQGKFATVDWPCKFFDWSLLSTRTSVFNDSEVNAYKAGTALKNYLSGLHTRFPSDRLNLFVHSQGNAVVGEAIEQGAPFDTYILTQGAMPASCYDVNAPTDSRLTGAESTYPTPESQPMGYRGIYTNMTGRIVNFYNSLDPVLNWWIKDQQFFKPDGYAEHLLELIPPSLPISSYYSYDRSNGYYNTPIGFGSYLVTDPEESRAMLSRSLTLPIGQSSPETSHGVIQSGIDLHAHFNFADTSFDDHSAQWAWPIQITRPYFQQVLRSCQIQPAQ